MVKAVGNYWILAQAKQDQDYLSLLAHSLSHRKKKDLSRMDGKIVFSKFLCVYEQGDITVMDVSRKNNPICMKPYKG